MTFPSAGQSGIVKAFSDIAHKYIPHNLDYCVMIKKDDPDFLYVNIYFLILEGPHAGEYRKEVRFALQYNDCGGVRISPNERGYGHRMVQVAKELLNIGR